MHDDPGALARIEAKVDQLLAAKDDHETRLRSLERVRWSMQGMWFVLGAALAWVVKHF